MDTPAPSIRVLPRHAGIRAVFLVEAPTKKALRQARELFDTVGQLAEVVPISVGTITSYAVETDGDSSLFGKIEWLLKTQFPFTLLERNFSSVTLRLVRSLCEEANTQVAELPECGICGEPDPFPLRASLSLPDRSSPVHLSYCARCASQHASDDPARQIRRLVAKDRRSYRLPADLPVVVMPEMVEERATWETPALAAAG